MDILVYQGWDAIDLSKPYLAEIYAPSSEILKIITEAKTYELDFKRSRCIGRISEIACVTVKGDDSSVKSFISEHLRANYTVHELKDSRERPDEPPPL